MGKRAAGTPASPGSGAGAGTPVRQTVLPCQRCTIQSQTVATLPANRRRTTIGVGEEVELTFSQGSARWRTTGGRLSARRGASVRFTAPDRAASATVTAVGANCTATITFTIVEPSGVRMLRSPGTGVRHRQNRPDSGMRTDIYLLPDTVCFYNIEYSEVDCPAVCTGVYTPFNGVGHDASPAVLSLGMIVVPGLGTQANATDGIYSGDPGTAAPFAPGNITFDIPYRFRVGRGRWKQFATVRQQSSLAANRSTLMSVKAGASVTCRVSDPTTTP